MEENALLIGMGGLGCAVALALAVAGIRRLGLVDDDAVALSNLHRQVLFHVQDLGRPKAEAARDRLLEHFPFLDVQVHKTRVHTSEELTALANGYRLMIDGSDNFATRFLANQVAIRQAIPLIHGAATGFFGQVTTVAGAPCLRCLIHPAVAEEEGACLREGVVGPLVGEIGWIMALEAVKILRGEGHPLRGRFLAVDLTSGRRRVIHYQPDHSCPVCGPASD